MLTQPYAAKADEWSAKQVGDKLADLKADGFAPEPRAPQGVFAVLRHEGADVVVIADVLYEPLLAGAAARRALEALAHDPAIGIVAFDAFPPRLEGEGVWATPVLEAAPGMIPYARSLVALDRAQYAAIERAIRLLFGVAHGAAYQALVGQAASATAARAAGNFGVFMGYDFQTLPALEQGLPLVTIAATFQKVRERRYRVMASSNEVSCSEGSGGSCRDCGARAPCAPPRSGGS